MNTFNVPFARELNDALWAMEKDPEVRVVVIDAKGIVQQLNSAACGILGWRTTCACCRNRPARCRCGR